VPQKTILVVDDSVTIRKILSRELKEAGYAVVTAENGAEALACLGKMAVLPDLITLDIDMPVMGGFEVCEKLREAAMDSNALYYQAAAIPILFISANDTLEKRARGYQLEVIDFISKPLAKGEISRAVGKVLYPKENFIGMRALVVEDSPVVRKIVANTLLRNGLAVTAVSDGLDALQAVEDDELGYDIVITDYAMPRIKGDELCRLLRKSAKMAQVPIFFISASDEKDTVLDFYKAGASDYLKKPFIVEELQARVITHLRIRKYVKELHELNERLKIQATRDALTGLYNRRYFQETVAWQFAKANRDSRDMCCLMLDLDHFKGVNDKLGHAFGDQVLREFAGLIRRQSRNGDTAARYGGEEFILILPDTEIRAAVIMARDIRRMAEQHLYKNGHREIRVTCSIGVASLQRHDPQTVEQLLAMADYALYEAKTQGRNQVRVFQQPDAVGCTK
jgi:two-component system, cell cycle response regulator